MKSLCKHSLILLASLFYMQSFTQDTIQSVQTPTVVVKARATKNKILLRWGVNNKYAWWYGTRHGYTIERTTILRDGQPLANPEKIILGGGIIKPKPLSVWESFAQQNDKAAVAAQALYGEDFEMNDDADNKVLKVIQESEELDRRFAFSMFVMDQDFEVAKFAGLGFEDTNVKTNEKYLYNIRSEVPSEMMDIEKSGVFISPSEEEELPKPIDFLGYYYKQSFVLVWEYESLLNFYTAYDLERSMDGVNFEKVNKVPITKLADNKSSGISFTDSIPEFNRKYWYRVVGISAFNEKSPPSNVVELFAYKGITSVPLFKDNVIVSEKEVLLSWTYPEEQEAEIKQFDLLRAQKAVGPYETIKEGLPPTARNYTYDQLQSINYFKLKVVGKNGQSIESSPNMVQPIDSIPPVKPTGLVGIIDTLGIVKLSWNANTELDLRGYKILRAERPNQEFSLLNKYSEKATSFIDTVNIETFNTYVYYKIMALDQRYNESEYSDVLVLKRPDKIPPTSPIFDSYEQKEDRIVLKWIKSSSDDVAKEILYRKASDLQTDLWEKVFETDSDTTAYFEDIKINPGVKYYYTLVAIDETGLESLPSPLLIIERISTLLKNEVKGLYANVNRDEKQINLFWRYKEENVQEFLIYKKKKGQQYSLFRTANATDRQLIDTELNPNTTYYYGIKAVFKDGTVSKWSEIKIVY